MRAIWLAALLASAVASAQSTAPATKAAPAPKAAVKVDLHRTDDIAKHRQMAKAHEEAARCLESGTDEAQCHSQLRAACKGIAVGQYCGMRHAH